jgi:DNA-binding response OmpR family regulator
VVDALVIKKGQRIVCESAPDVPLVLADAFRLKQILINLLSNAHKFSPEGSTITLRAQGAGPAVCFSVIDQGPGIRPEHQEAVFQEFVQVDDGMTREQQGTGLGLPITRRLVEMHGGRIWVESDGVPGHGAALHFTIPTCEACETRPPDIVEEVVVPAAPNDGHDRTVLIVDDDRQFNSLLATYFRQQGYTPVSCYDGRSALHYIHNVRPALISLDLMLPGRDGWSILHDLKSDPETCAIPVIILSALDYTKTGLDQTNVEYLHKPLDQQALLAALRRIASPPHRVLVVEDDPLIIELLEAMLPQLQYSISLARNGLEALAMIAADLPEAIILDLMLPDISGEELLELLRADPNTQHVAVIILTAKVLSPAAYSRLAATAQTVILKHELTRDRLIDALHRLHLPALPVAEVRS